VRETLRESNRPLRNSPLEVQRQTQFRSGRKEHCALDDVRQFTNFPGPVLRFEPAITSSGIRSMGFLVVADLVQEKRASIGHLK
jgi:hypothetical protein